MTYFINKINYVIADWAIVNEWLSCALVNHELMHVSAQRKRSKYKNSRKENRRGGDGQI